jgi:potassium-transporting ATPase KdpC subunit
MRAQLLVAVRALLVLTVLCGMAYPLLVTGVAQGLFDDKADGSLIERDGAVVGSSLLGQDFTGESYFHPRPSAVSYVTPEIGTSGASNLGPTNDDFLSSVEGRAAAYRAENGLAGDAPVPVDAVTASASGLDPHISPANAKLQAPRVAQARGTAVDDVMAMIDDHTDGRTLGVFGEPGVNVLELNLALDRTHAVGGG